MKTVLEFCVRHGYGPFFVGWTDDDECLFCPVCHPDHVDNPAVVEAAEFDAEAACRKVCAL